MTMVVVLSALIACGSAAPSLKHSPSQYAYAGPVASYASAAPVLVQEYQPAPAAYAKVAEFVESVPSSVSHHSSAVVHNTAAVATPVITPVAKATIVSAPAPLISTPIVEDTPIVEEVHEAQYVAPIVKQVQLQPQAYAKVGEFVEHRPSSVSHHSSSVIHSSAAVATLVITPVAKTVVATAPVYQSAPLLKTVPAPAAIAVHEAPLLKTVQAPAAYAVHEAPLLREIPQEIVEIRPEIQPAPAAYAKVAEFVEHRPSSFSHHSSSVVHSSAAVATPVITPVAKTVVATASVYQSAPLLKTVPAPAAIAVHEAPLLKTVQAPAAYAVHEAPLYNSLTYAAYNYGPAYYNEPLLRSW